MYLSTVKSVITNSNTSFFRFRKKNVNTPIDVHISVYKDHLNEGFREKLPLASVVAQRWYIAPGVQRVNVTEKGLKAILYIPTGITDRGLDISFYTCLDDF